jgi:integrase/recombinase XerD
MTWSLLDSRGRRKYLTSVERAAFVQAALAADRVIGTFCLTLALTGARISEVLALTADRVDVGTSSVVFETLKRRERGVFRAVPVPSELLSLILDIRDPILNEDQRLWRFSRPTAWKYVKRLMVTADVPRDVAKPKALRHAFGVEAVQKRIALSVVKKWLGHAKIETTAIYADPIGDEERALARLTWEGLAFTARPEEIAAQDLSQSGSPCQPVLQAGEQ